MKKLLLVAAMLLGLAAPAMADNRINWYYAQNPPVDWLNFMSIYHREADGQKTLDFMGQNTAMKYTNLTLSPTGSSFSAAVTAGANQFGSVYQYTVVDTASTPATTTGTGSILIPPDASQIMNQATLLAPVTLGPFTPPGTAGQSIIYLVESQISTTDQVPFSAKFFTSTGTGFNQTVNRERDDSPVFQTKASSASTSPTVPSTDSGWVCIASIRVPQGTPATLVGATITPCPAWQGFADSSDVAHLTGALGVGSTNISGTSTASQFVSTVATGAPPFIVSSTTPVANLSIGGNAATATNVTGIVALVNGGTGTATPALIAGNGITVTGAFPNTTIALASSPAIVGLNLSGLNASQCVRTDGSKNLASSSTDCITGLTAGLNGAVGSGTTPSVGTIANPSFTAITDTGLTASSCVRTNASKVLTSGTADCIVGITAGLNTVVGGTFTNPSIATTATPSFTSITDSGLTSGLCVQTTTGGLFTTAGAACGAGGGISSVVGTAPIIVGLVSGTATVSIDPNPTLTSLTLSGLTASLPVCTDASKVLSTSACAAGGVASVTAGDANLTISPTTGAVVATLAASPSITSVTLSGSTPIALSGTGTNTITSASAGAGVSAFQFNSIGANTGFLADFRLAGISKFNVDTTGVITGTSLALSGVIAGATTGAFSGTITDSNATPLAFSGTGTNTITSAATGTNTGFVLNTPGSPTSVFDVQFNGTSNLKIDSSGNSVMRGGLTATNGSFSSTSGVGAVLLTGAGVNTIQSASGASATAFSFKGTTSRTGAALVTFVNNATTVAQIGTTSGNAGVLLLAPTINSNTGLGVVSPTYTVGGAQAAATMHTILGLCVFSASVTCTPTAFSNSAVFSSATSYSCSASGGAGTFAQTGALSVGSQSTTGIIITAATSNSQTVTFLCQGS